MEFTTFFFFHYRLEFRFVYCLFCKTCFVHFFSFFFNDTATTEIYTLSLHDALPISLPNVYILRCRELFRWLPRRLLIRPKLQPFENTLCNLVTSSRITVDRKSTRLNSSHANISYAVFCLKKKKNNIKKKKKTKEKKKKNKIKKKKNQK